MTRKRSSPMGLEIYLSAMLAFIMLPLLVQAAPLQDYTEIQQYTEGCYYNYNHYNEGDRILTNEPCLNCTCHNKMLMCYLRVCPFTKPIGHDCIVEKREDQCCPIITCPEVPVDVAHSAPEPGTELSFPEKFGCSIDGKFYLEGAQVPSNPSKPCELCYCIKNRTSCLMQECTLHIDGCTPIYNKGSCCPVRYNCDHENDVLELEDHSTTTEAATTTTTERPTTGFIITSTMTPAVSTDCVHSGELYADGARIAGETACENCYCMRGDIICAVQECHMPMLAGNGKSCHALPAAEGECCPSNYVCEDDTATTQIIEATTMPYAGLDEEAKITTSAPVKDLHSAIPEEDLQLQTHIDEEETATKIPSADKGEEVTESAVDVKPTGMPSAEEEPKEQDQETVTKPIEETEAVTTSDAKSTQGDEVVTKAPIFADELHETITEAVPDAKKEGKPEDIDETTTKAPTPEEGEETQPEDVTVAGEEASTKSPIAAEEVPEISTYSTIGDDEFVTKTPLAEEHPFGVTEVAQEEDRTEAIVTKAPKVDGVVSEVATQSPEEVFEESTESVEEEIKPVAGDESVTKPPTAIEEDVSTEASKEEQEPGETDEHVTKTPMEQITQATEGGKPEEEQDKFVTKAPIAGDEGRDELVTKAPIAGDEEQDEIATKAPIAGDEEQDEIVTKAPTAESEEQDEVVTKAPTAESEEQDEIVTKAPIAGDEEQDEIVTKSPITGDKEQDEITTKAPIAGDEEQDENVTKAPSVGDEEQDEVATKAPTVAVEEQGEDVTKAPIESVEEPEVSTEGSGEETEELSTRTPSTEDEEKPDAGEKEKGDSTEAAIIEDEITSTTAAPIKTISETKPSKEGGKPVETEEQQPEAATKVPTTDEEEQEISTESADEATPTLADGLSATVPSIKDEEEPAKSIETSAESEEEDIKATEGPSIGGEDREMATKTPKIGEEEPSTEEVFTKAPVSADEDQETFTEAAEASGEGKPVSTDDQSIDVSTFAPEEHKHISADEFGSGDYSTESSDEETSEPSSISSSTEGVTSAPQKEQEEDISTGKPIVPSEKKPSEEKLHEKEETSTTSTMDIFEDSVESDDDQETVDVTTVKYSVTAPVTSESGEVPEEEKEIATKLPSEVEEDISATTIKSETPVEHTTAGINADITTIKTADEEKVEGGLPPSGEAEDKIDITTMATAVNKEQPSVEQQPIVEHKNELPEKVDFTTHASVFVETSSIPTVEKESSEEETSGEEEKTKPDSEESIESEEVTTQRSIDIEAQPTTVAPAIEVITESEDDQHKVMPESDDHKAEEPAEITDSPMVIIEDMSAFTTPKSTVDEDTKTETDADKEQQEVESTTIIPTVGNQKDTEKLPSLDTRGDLDEGVPATTVKAVREESSAVEEMPDMQLPSVIPGEGDCLVGQKTYENNTVVPTSDECEITCKCVSSIVTCERVKCEIPENVEQCTLDEASTNKCCTSYICGADSMPPKTDDSAESVEDDEDEEIQFTTLAAPHKESKDKSEQTTFKPAVAPEEASTVLSIPDIEIPIASTEQPMSHVKDEEEIEQHSTESLVAVMAEDKKDIVTDSEISTTPAVAVEDVVLPQSMTPVETSEKETDQDISTEKSSGDAAQESSPELPIAQPELKFDKTTTAPVIDNVTDSSEQPPSEEEEEHKEISTTGAPSADEYQTVKPIDKKEDEEEKTSDEIITHTDKPIISQDEFKTPPAIQKETELGTQTTVPTTSSEEEDKETQTATSAEKETSEKPETHTDIPSVSSEEEENKTPEEPEVHTVIPSVSSEEQQTETTTPVDTEKEHPETQTRAPVAADEIQTVPPTGEKPEVPMHATEGSTETPVAAEPHSEEPSTDIELQTIAPESKEKEPSSTEESVEDISTGGTTVAPVKDDEDIERSTAVPDTQEQSSTAAPKQPVDVSDESIEPLDHTVVPSAEQPEFTSTVASISEDEEEDHADTTTITPVSKVEKGDDAEIHTFAPVTKDEDKESALPTKEEEPVEQGIEGTTTAPATPETSKLDAAEDTSTKSVTPLDDEALEHTLAPIVLDETKETTDDTVASTSAPVLSSDIETTSESIELEKEPETQTTIPSEESVEKDKETVTVPSVDEDMAAETTDSSVEGAYKEPTDMATDKPIDTSEEGTDKKTTDMATDKPIDFETKIDTSTEVAAVPTIAPTEDIVEDVSNTTITPVKKDEKESAEEPIESTSVKEEGKEPTVTMVPNGESAEAFETTPAPVEKVTEASEGEEEVTVPSTKQDKDKLKPSMATPVDEKEIDHTAVPVTDDKESVTSAPVAFDEHVPEEDIESITTRPIVSDESTSEGVSSEEESTEKIDMAPVKEDEIVPVSIADMDKPVSPVEGFTTVAPVVEDEAQSTISPAKKPSLDLSEEESGESVESEEEISSEPPKIQHIGEFVTDRIDEVTAIPTVLPATLEKEGEKEASGEEAEDIEPATDIPQLPAVEQGDEITITTAAPTKTTEEPEYVEVSTDKLPEEGEDVVPSITKSPTDEEESTPAVTKSPIAAEDTEGITAQLPEEQDNVPSVTKSPVAAEYVTAQQPEQEVADVIPSVTKAPITAEDIERVTTQEPEEQDIVLSVTKAPISAEDIEQSEEEEVPSVTKVPFTADDVERVTTQQSEDEDVVPSVTKTPISAEDVEGVTTEHPETDVTPVSKAPISDIIIEGITAQQPGEEIIPSVTKAPISAEDIGGSTAQQPEKEVTMAPILFENVEGATPQQPEEESTPSVTNAPASSEDIEGVTAKQPEDVVPSVTKAPILAEDTEGSTAKQPEDVIPSVTKAPVSAEADEGVTAQQSEEDAVPSVTNAPFADEEVEGVTAQRPEDEDVSAVTKAPEDIDIATGKQPEEDISAVTKAPAAAEDVDTSTVQPPKEGGEVVDDTKAPETSEETETTTAKLPTQQSDEITEAAVTQVPSSDFAKDIVTEVPLEAEIVEDATTQKPEEQEEDVAPSATKAPHTAEDVTSPQPEQHAVTKAPMSAEEEEDIDTATGKPSEDEQEGVFTVTTAPAAAEDIDMTTTQPSREGETIGVTKAPQTPEEMEATTSKLPTQQADEITAITQVPTTDVDDNKTEQAPKLPEEADKETSATTDKLSEFADHATELPTNDTEEQKEVTELPVVSHEASTVGQTVDQSTESATKAGEEESSEETYTEAVEEDRLQPTTTVHPLFPHITTMPSVALDSRIDDTNATTIAPVKNAENEQDEYFNTLQTSSSTSSTSAPITTSAPHYQPQPPVYGQSPQYGPTQYEDEYTDEDEGEVFGPGTCRYGGKLYVSAQQIPRDDPCDFCFCFRSDIICLQQSCPPPIAGCHEEPISGFCCPRYECPVSMATVLNITTSTTTTSTTLPPHFLHHSYGNNVQRNGCLINGRSYRVGEKIESTSGPCINCTCGGDGKMKCDPQACVPEPTMQQVMAVVAAGRKR